MGQADLSEWDEAVEYIRRAAERSAWQLIISERRAGLRPGQRRYYVTVGSMTLDSDEDTPDLPCEEGEA